MKNFIYTFFLFCTLAACKNEPKQEFPKTGNADIDALTEAIFKNPKDAQLYFRRAQLFYKNAEQGGYSYALKDMQYALEIDSVNLGFHNFLADMYIRPPEGEQPQSRLAVTTLERAVGLYPDSMKTVLNLAKLYYLTDQNQASMTLIDKILKRDAQNASAFFLLAKNFQRLKKDELAIGAFQRTADLDSKNVDAFIEIAQMYEAKNDPKALKYLDNALTVDPQCAPALLNKGVYFFSRKRYAEALEVYQQMQQSNPHDPDVYFNIGVLYLDQDSTAKARANFDIAIKEKPTYFRAYYGIGECEEKTGDKAEAIKNYQQAIALMPSYQKAKDKLAKLGVK
ncbi:MAG: hypothetical protein RL757_2014 [Bacteroidota bacterium]|jgi:tetratricopeptide (TPR) repeat protein